MSVDTTDTRVDDTERQTPVAATPRRRAFGRSADISVVVGFAALAAAATFTNAPGEVIADARLEHFTEPAQFLARHADIWDDQRTLGEPAKYFSPVLAAVQSLVASTGAPTWVVQRFTHALLLTVAATGSWALCRAVFGRRAWGPAAGLIYAFGPYSSQYLLPSGLYSAYAVAPWLALAAWRGTSTHRRWAGAAFFALVVFSVGMLNTPALVLACVPALAMMVLRVGLDGTWRNGLGWAWRTVVLTVGVSLPMLVTLSAASESIAANLESTETPDVVGATSSASESLRGLGFWLTYFRLGGGSFRSNVESYFTSPVVIVASFAAVVLAGIAMVVAADRRTGALASLAGFATVVMVGLHPVDDPSPLGRLLGKAFDASTFVRGFRSTYKAGSSLQLAVALLAAVALAWGWSQLRSAPARTRGVLGTIGVVAVAGLAIASFPFSTGALYPEDERFETIPDYWTEAFAWFEDQPHDQGVFVLPSLARTPYRWGYVNDTLFDGFLAQRAVTARTLPQSTRVLAELTEHLDEYAGSRSATPGSLAPALRRMGVRWLLIQNDVDWQSARVPRPATWDHIRSDPGFALARTFGEPGSFTVGAPEADPRYAAERALAPIEVYELVDADPAGPIITAAPVVVAGGGEAWPSLSADGWLDTPVRHLADIELDDRDALAGVEHLVFTDGGRRRATRVVSSQSAFSHVLADGADAVSGSERRSARPLFDDPAQQTVARYGDIASITATGYGPALTVWDAAWRPANAIDGDPRTAWTTAGPGPQSLQVELRTPIDGPDLTIEPWLGDDGTGRLEGYRVSAFDADGHPVAVGMAVGPDPEGRYRFDAGDADAVAAIEIGLVVDPVIAAMVGVAELTIDHRSGRVATGEVLRVAGPTTAAAAEALTAALDARPELSVHHRFVRSQRGADLDEESTIARRFWAPGGPVDVRLDVRVDGQTPDETIAALLGEPIAAVSSARYLGAIDAAAANALDDNVGTAWQFAPERPADLTITMPATRVDEIELWSISIGSLPFRLARMSSFDLILRSDREPERTVAVDLDPEPDCDAAFAEVGIPCVERTVVAIEPPADSLTEVVLRPRDLEPAGDSFSSLPVQIAEVVIRDEGISVSAAPSDRMTGPDTCVDLVAIDDVAVAMRPEEPVSLSALTAGVRWTSCEPIELDSAWHDIAALPQTAWAVAQIALDPPGRSDTRAVAPTRRPTTWSGSGSRRQVTAGVEEGDVIVTDAAEHPGWTLDADGVPGTRLSVDGRVAWRADASGDVRLELAYRPQQHYRLAWLVAAATIATCVWLLLPGRRRPISRPDAALTSASPAGAVLQRAPDPSAGDAVDHDEAQEGGSAPEAADTRRGTRLVTLLAATTGGALIAGPPGLVAGAVLGVLIAFGSRRIGVLALGLVLVTALATMLEGPLDAESVRRFPTERPSAHVFGLFTALTWIAAGVAAWLQSPATTKAVASEEDEWDRRRPHPMLLVALVAGAVAAVRVLVT